MPLFKGKTTSTPTTNTNTITQKHDRHDDDPLGQPSHTTSDNKPKIGHKKKEKDEPIMFTSSETFTLTREKPKEVIKPVPVITNTSSKDNSSSVIFVVPLL